MEWVGQLLDGGGALALALVVWYELRAFRKAMVEAIGDIKTKQEVIVERQKVIADHITNHQDKLQLKLMETLGGNNVSHS